MKAYLLSIGQAANRCLTSIIPALCCGAGIDDSAPEVSHDLRLFQIEDHSPEPALEPLIRDINVCHQLFARNNSPFFPCAVSISGCRPAFPPVGALQQNPVSAGLLGALRGSGIPLSYKTDREASEWAFSVMLREDPCPESLLPMKTWLRQLRSETASKEAPEKTPEKVLEKALSDAPEEGARLILLSDVTDAFAGGVLLALLPWLRETLPAKTFLALFALAPIDAGRAEAAQLSLRAFFTALSDRNLLRVTEGRDTAGADAAWLLSLPSSLTPDSASLALSSWTAAGVLNRIIAGSALPSFGLHTLETPAVFRLASLGDNARETAAFLMTAVWCLSDLFPALSAWREHSGRLRALSAPSRSGIFRRFFGDDRWNESPPVRLSDAFPALENSLRAILSVLLSLLKELPEPLRRSDEAQWQTAVNACGRYVTLASEYDVSTEEARESGVDHVMPVHRVSMADTEEEKALRRLDDLESELSAILNARTVALSALGGFRAWQVLEDCREKCSRAEETAIQKLKAMAAEKETDHLRLGLQERRVRLLQAAVLRCKVDLQEAAAYPALSARPAGSKSAKPSYESELLNTAAAAALREYLFAAPSARPAAEKQLRDHLPDLFSELQLPDSKALWKSLQDSAAPQEGAPLADFFAAACSVCRQALASLRPASGGNLPAIPLLPDALTEKRLSGIPALLSCLPETGPADQTAHLRGLLAMLVLRQYRQAAPEEATLSREHLSGEASTVLAAWLSGTGVDSVWLYSLNQGETTLPVALALPGKTLLSARWTKAHLPLLPAFAFWFDADTLSFRDPCRMLGDSDRAVLTEWIQQVQKAGIFPESSAFGDFLSVFLSDLVSGQAAEEEEDPAFEVRLQAACGLPGLAAYASSVRRVSVWYEHALSSDLLAASLCGQETFPSCACHVPEEIQYTWRGIPFARENRDRLLESLSVPEEKAVLSSLETECGILFRSSDDYRDLLTAQLSALLSRYPEAMESRRKSAGRLLARAGSAMKEMVTDLTWPWDAASPAVRTILAECLGPELTDAAMSPFSDLLTVIPARTGDIIGDALFEEMCTMKTMEADPEAPDQVRIAGDTLLPPLSPAFAAKLCLRSEGKTLIHPSLLQFEKLEEGAFRVRLTLEGGFTLRLSRVYREREILSLYAHDLPTLAVWPSVPFAPEDWHAYYLYAHLAEALRLSVTISEERPCEPVSGAGFRRVMSVPSFPLCFILHQGEKSIGALPNLLPPPEIPRKGTVLGCVDFGSAGSSVILADREERFPLNGPILIRTILNHPTASRALLQQEFIPAVPISAIFPTLVRIFRNQAGAEPLPLEDGMIFRPDSVQDLFSAENAALYTSLKWEDEKGRAATLYLHHLLLTAALEARFAGATSLLWRFALPDGMASPGRENLVALLKRLTALVAAESGLPAPDKMPSASFALESSALGAYFRYCAREDTRGGFTVLDLGACTADLSLFLRGGEHAQRSCQLSLGIHYFFLPTLLRRPQILSQDLDLLPPENEILAESIPRIQALLLRAASDPAALRLARAALDQLIAEHLPQLAGILAQRRAEGRPTFTGALLLLHLSYLMMLCGLLLLEAAEDPRKNDLLPEQMTLCLSGRGNLLTEILSPPVKSALWRFLAMFRNRRIVSYAMLFSAEKKLEIPVGLSLLQDVTAGAPAGSTASASIPLHPEELLPEFLIRFFGEFPQEAVLLFPGFFTGDPMQPLTPYGFHLIQVSIQSAFTPVQENRPYDALASWLPALLELVQSEG